MLQPYEKVDFIDHVQDVETGEILLQGTPLSRQTLGRMDDAIAALYDELDVDSPDSALATKATVFDATATYADGTFTLTGTPAELPSRFTLRFTAPEKYTSGDVLQIGGTQLAVTTMAAPAEAAPDDAWATGALVVLNVDLATAKAFLAGGGGGGSTAAVQAEPPATGKPGELWINPDTKIAHFWYDDQWIPLAGTAV